MMMTRKNDRIFKRIIALALAFFCIAGVFSWPVSNAAAADEIYGRVTMDNVKVRKSASTSADYWFKLPKGWASQIMETVVKNGVTWFKVTTNGPTQGTRTYVGYIHSDYYVQMTEQEQADWLANPVQPGVGVVGATATPTPVGATPTPTPEGMTPAPAGTKPTPIPDPSNLGYISKGGVNFRETPGGLRLASLDRNTLVELVEIPAYLTEEYWFKVKYNGKTGYIQGPFITILTKAEADALQTGATAAPTATPVNTSYTIYGYVKLQDDGVNLRDNPGGSVLTRIDGKPVLAFYKAPVSKSNFLWYWVKTTDGIYGYVRSDMAVVTDANGYTAAPAVTPTPTPGQTAAPETVYGYIRLTDDGVNLRDAPGGKPLTRIDGKPVMPIYKAPVAKNGVNWYYVKINNVGGYVHGGFAVVTDAAGNTAAPTVTATPTPAPTASPAAVIGYIVTTQDKVNLRKTPNGGSLCQIALGQVLPLTAQATKSGSYIWYPVQNTDGRKGYIRGDMAVPCDQSGVTAAPTATPTPAPVNAVGYVMVTKQSVNLRKSIGGATIASLDKNTVWPMVAAAVKSGSYTWFPVDVNGTKGFLRSDATYQLSTFQVEAYLRGEGVPTPSPTPSPTPGPSNYVITTADKVNLRTSASKDANAPYNVEIGTVMHFTGSTTSGGALWYKVEYEDSLMWVLGSCVKVMNTQEYNTWLAAQPTPTPSPTPSPTPRPEDLSDMAETSQENVLVRATGSASGKQVTKIYKKGVILTLTGSTNQEGTYTYYSVKLESGTKGYIRGDLIRIYTKDEKQAYLDSLNSGGGKEATYETLRKGSTGDAVKALQTELKKQGYYTSTISGTYGTVTVEAVKAFQKAKGLTADGVANAATQHKLFGTVPPGTNDEELGNTIHPVEKIDWVTGGINALWARGMNVKVTDVKTGITFWAHRWAGGNHVDAEPLTAADTRRLCKIYGVSSAQEIEDQNLYQRRPLWVTIGSRTFAASLYGVPHNYPDGDTIANNDYKGQFCVHFTNSKTHTSNRVDPLHTEAIQYAYDAYWNKH